MNKTETHFVDIVGQILSKLENASSSVKIASSWFTSHKILKKLLEIKEHNPNLEIEIIVSENEINRNNYWLKNVEELCIASIYWIPRNLKNGIMHHKFCIIDSILVITGSFNWTNQAEKNNENINIIYETLNISQFENEFRELKSLIKVKAITAFSSRTQTKDNEEFPKSEFLEVTLEIKNKLEKLILKEEYEKFHIEDFSTIGQIKSYLIDLEKIRDKNEFYKFSKQRINKELNINNDELLSEDAKLNYDKLKIKAINLIMKDVQSDISKLKIEDNETLFEHLNKLKRLNIERQKLLSKNNFNFIT